ncbi:MAG TPA: hypothetical protein VKH37_06225 [Ferruginibacter sp.]|nr:hypothetical protein [Ferruginibacter sp.]
MRGVIKFFVVVLFILPAVGSKAQPSAMATASATIVTPVSIDVNTQQQFETIDNKIVGEFNLVKENTEIPKELLKVPCRQKMIRAAALNVKTGIGDLYTLSMPGKILLVNSAGKEKIEATIYGSGQQPGNNDQRSTSINALLNIPQDQLPCRYASQAFEVTVNFN